MKMTKMTAAPPARRRRGPRLAAAVMILLALLGLAWGGYWMVLTSQLDAGVQRWIGERRAEGYAVTYGDMARGGFPVSARVVITAPAIAAPGDGRANAVPWTWSAPRLVAAINPFDPRRFSLDAPGAHALSIGEGAGQARYAVEADRLTVMGEAGREGGALVARDLVLKPLAQEAFTTALSEPTIIARLDAHGRPAAPGAGGEINASYHMTVRAADAVLPLWLGLPLGPVVESLAFEATVQERLAFAPWPEALLRWRDAGGALDVTAVEARYGPLVVNGSGTLALDAAAQPVGAFAARVSGLFQAIDALRARGHMGAGEAVAAKLALNLLAGSPDRQAPLTLPLTLQDRVLSIGPVPLMQFPEIYWIAPPPR